MRYGSAVAPLPVISDVYRCAINWSNTTSLAQATNVIHIRKSGSNPADIFADLDAHFAAAMWQAQAIDTIIANIVITPLDGTSVSFPVVPTPGVKYHGVASTGDMSPQTANIVKFLTAKRGRSYRGRLYLPFPAESATSNGKLTGATVTAGQAAWVTFVNAMNTAGSQIVVASYVHATAENVIATLYESFTATQRRRQKRLST